MPRTRRGVGRVRDGVRVHTNSTAPPTTAAIHHQLLTMNPTTNRALSICYVSQLNW